MRFVTESSFARCRRALIRVRVPQALQQSVRESVWGILALLGFACGAQGQQALWSALDVSRAIELSSAAASPTPVPDQHHLGPVQFTMGASASLGWVDNVNLSAENPQADELVQAGLSTGWFWPATERTALRLAAGGSYHYYFHNRQYNGFEIAPNSVLNWDIGFPDGSVSLFDMFSYSQQIITEAALANTGTLPRYDNTAGARVTWTPGRWLTQAGYSHETFFSNNSAYEYLNRSSELMFLRGGWRFAEATQAGVEASGSITSYQQRPETAYSVSVGPYLDWQITQALLASIRGGSAFNAFENSGAANSPNSTLPSYYAGVFVSHQLTADFSHYLNVRRDVQLGLNRGSDYVEQLTAEYAVSYNLTRWVGLGLSLTYENGTQPFQTTVDTIFGPIPVSEIEKFDRFGVGLRCSWQLTAKLSASLGYTYWQRGSNIPKRGYSQNNVSLQLSYNY